MLYILDTDLLTLHRHGATPRLSARIDAARDADDLAITVITVEEQISGWYRLLGRAKNPAGLSRAYYKLAETVQTLADYSILLFNEPAIARYVALRSLKLKVGSMDLRIAAIVLEVGATLITRNLRDFRQVPGLMVEDWSV